MSSFYDMLGRAYDDIIPFAKTTFKVNTTKINKDITPPLFEPRLQKSLRLL
jgi:hypothetical protein